MICRLATLLGELCRIFSKERGIRKPAAFLYYYFRFRTKKFLKSRAQFEKFLGLRIHFPDYQQFYALWNEIFLHETYFISLSPSPAGNKNLKIIDAGSNIGLSILYFKCLYPNSKITGLEVSDSTFDWLKKNVDDNNLKNVEIINIGLAGHAGTVKFFDCGDGSGGSNIVEGFHSDMVRKVKEAKVKTLSSFLKEEVDLLKIDIEGSEFDVFREADGELRKARNIIIEVHQVAGEKNSKISDILEILDKNGFRYAITETSITNRMYVKTPTSRYNIIVSAKRI